MIASVVGLAGVVLHPHIRLTLTQARSSPVQSPFGVSQNLRLHTGSYTSQIATACLRDPSLSLRAGTNSCATKPSNPVSTIAFMIGS